MKHSTESQRYQRTVAEIIQRRLKEIHQDVIRVWKDGALGSSVAPEDLSIIARVEIFRQVLKAMIRQFIEEGESELVDELKEFQSLLAELLDDAGFVALQPHLPTG
jgi:hypothetical protein